MKRTFHRNLNLFWFMVGNPTTGKTTAINLGVVNPLKDVPEVNKFRKTNTTSGGLTDFLSKNGALFMVSSEISMFLQKVLKSDEAAASSDVELLCMLYSGEEWDLNMVSNSRKADANTPFSILGKYFIINNYFTSRH